MGVGRVKYRLILEQHKTQASDLASKRHKGGGATQSSLSQGQIHQVSRLRQDWKLQSLHQDPEFIALLDELEADILNQRQWYEENKDKPLL